MQSLIVYAYLLAAVLFILGMRRLNSPATARSGNQLSSVGMLIAVVATLLQREILAPWMIVGGLALGAAIGAFLATRVQMTSMPEMVAALNGFGGGASVLVATAEVARYMNAQDDGLAGAGFALRGLEPLNATTVVTVLLSVLIGSVTFSGSFVAFGKLNGKVSGKPLSFPGMRAVTALLALLAVAAIVYALLGLTDSAFDAEPLWLAAWVLVGLALVLGVLLVIPIGGADMPVVRDGFRLSGQGDEAQCRSLGRARPRPHAAGANGGRRRFD